MGTADQPVSCIIGAGSSGIATAKALHQRGLPYDCFEKSDDVGGVWYYNNPNGMSAAYRSLHINTSKHQMQFADFPMPEDYPDYASHEQIFRYFKDYVDHFGFRDTITFNTGVERAHRRDDGLWEVTLDTGATRLYDNLFVCNGHHWDPRWPAPPFPGKFDGQIMHAHDYRTPTILEGKRVLLLGIGNSAMDIAVEATYVAERVFVAMRRGAHVLPKYILGRPTDHWVLPYVPFWLAQRLFGFLLRLQVGKAENYGLPRPDHKIMQAHPTISTGFLDRLGHGAIIPKPNIKAFEGGQVRFVDDSTEAVDLIIYCTGYNVTFPFLDEALIAVRDNDLPLYRRMLKPGLDNLFFIGLYQPLGAIFPLAEIQAEIAAEYLLGRCAFPPRQEMERDIEQERAAMFRRYVQSRRHTMQVDFHPFKHQLQRLLKQGRRRAAADGNALPVPARARKEAHATPPSG